MGVPQGPVASPVTIRPAEVEIEPVAGVLDRSEALEPPIWGWRNSSWLDSAGHGGCARSGEEGPSVGRQGLSGGMAQGVQGRSSPSSQRRRGSAGAGVLGGRSTGGCSCRSFDWKLVEDGIAQKLLTLPLEDQRTMTLPLENQRTMLLSWFRRFLKLGDNCPNLQRAFDVWWRRTFVRLYVNQAEADRGADILDNCLANVRINSGTLKFDEAKVCVRELDWKLSWPPPVSTCDPSDPSLRYLWSAHEIDEAEKATVLFAADVIYSDDLTDLFFDTVKKLMSSGAKKVLYLALEKRYNFSLDELDVVANGYAHFRGFFVTQDEHGDAIHGDKPGFVGKQIGLAEIPQYIREYERGNDLEIWEIMYSPEQKLR